MKRFSRFPWKQLVVASVCAGLVGCSKTPEEITLATTPPTPKAAATQLQQAFTSAAPEVKTSVTAASQAIQNANYEQAIQSIQTIKAQKNLTMEQGMAIYNSEVALEAKLLAAMNAGDANAKRAYDQLRKSRRN